MPADAPRLSRCQRSLFGCLSRRRGLLTSACAAEEARRTLDEPEQRSRLTDLLRDIEIVFEGDGVIERDPRLREKDEPILRAAVAAGATHQLTGDLRDFGHLLGRRVSGVLVQTPGAFLRAR